MFFRPLGQGDHTFLPHFVIYRILGGIGVGLASMLSPMYIAEVAPSSIRGRLVSWNQFAIIFGMLVVYFVNFFIARHGNDSWLHNTGWRWMFASEIIPAGVFFILLFFIPETPRYLVIKKRPEKALLVLQKINGIEKAKVILTEIQSTIISHSAKLFSYGFLVIITGTMLSVFQQFVGINVVLYYAPEIFRNMGSGTDNALLQTIIVGVINLTFTVVAIQTVDKYGRKPLQIVVWVLLSEIFPNQIRGRAMAVAVAAQWISNYIISSTFPILDKSTWLTERFNHGFSYWIYGLMGLLAAWFMWKFVPETKGKSLEKLEKVWK